MIEFSRALARRFRAVLRKCLPLHARREPPGPVVFSAERTSLKVTAVTSVAILEFTQQGSYLPGLIAVPGEVLADCEGRQETPVRLVENADGVLASWQDQVVPRTRQYEAVKADRLPKVPVLPDRFTAQVATFFSALQEAARTTQTESPRYATHCIQLRGRAGQVVATDGKQLLLQEGFNFPWKEDVLIPALAVFGCKELEGATPIEIGRSEKFVTLRLGSWTLHIPVNEIGRFPNCESVIPKATETASVVRLSPGGLPRACRSNRSTASCGLAASSFKGPSASCGAMTGLTSGRKYGSGSSMLRAMTATSSRGWSWSIW